MGPFSFKMQKKRPHKAARNVFHREAKLEERLSLLCLNGGNGNNAQHILGRAAARQVVHRST